MAKMIKDYTLFLHYKQGDDFHSFLEHTKGDNAAAFEAWGASFKENAAICSRLAKLLVGKNIEIHADTHHIGFHPKDKEAEKLLAMLATETVIHVEEMECEDDDEDVDENEVDNEC